MNQSKYQLFDIDLRLFDGAGGEGSGAADGGQVGTNTASDAGKMTERRAKSGEMAVIYGKQDAPVAGEPGEGAPVSTGVETTSSTLEERRRAFDEMISGEYKDVFDEKFQRHLNRRFKEVKTLENSLSAQKPVIDMLLQRYKITDGDMGKLQTAIEQDDAYWEEAAEQAGMSIEQYRAVQKLERENAELRLMREHQQGRDRMNQQLQQWAKEAEEVRGIYPGFDFRAEMDNRDFVGLLRSGLPVQRAYEVIHMDEIKAAAARTAAQSAGEQMVAKLKTKASRPQENGVSDQSAAVIKSDVSKLSREDRARVAQLAMRGEKIKF